MRVVWTSVRHFVFLLGLLLIATGTSAGAKTDAAKSKDKSRPRAGANLEPRTAPKGKKSLPGNEVVESLKLIEGDEKTNEVRALKTELMVSRAETKAIDQIERLIKKYKGTELEPDLQFRLAELHMRRAKTARFFEIHRKSETLVQVAPKLVANASSRRHIESAIAGYELIQKKFPRFKQLDLVIFNNAFARQQLGQERESERLYWFLIQNFRGSPLVPDCHLAIGEINFDRANFSFALEHFNAIKKFPEAKVYPYGLYKAAWSHYNLRETEAGLKNLEEVVAYGRFVAERNIDARLDLRKEALADMTVFYEDVRPSKDAFAYFKRQAGELDVGPVVLKLAKLYEHHSRYADRMVILNDFIANIPDSPHVAQIHGELIWNYDSMKRKDLAVAQMEKLHEVCRENSAWLKSQRRMAREQSLPDPRLACTATLSEAAMKLAGRWLKIWKKNPAGAVDYADAAEKSFEIYLREPGAGKEHLEARYAYAELLFQRQKFRQASAEYAKVSSDRDAGALRHDAGYAAVVSLEKAVGDKWSDGDEKTFHELAKSYVANNPKGQYRLDVEFKIALIAYDKNRLEEAGPLFLRLGREFAQSEKGKKAQDLYLDILNLKKDYRGLREYSKELLRAEGDATRQTRLQKLHEQAYFLEVQSLEESEKWTAAITGYKEFAAANPKSDLAEKAWWNAVQLHYKILDFAGGARAAEEFYDRFPTAKNALDALLKAAESYESMGKLEPAADVLTKIAKAEPKNATKWNALAADFYLLSGGTVKAKRLLQDLRQSAEPQVRAQSLDKLLLIERATGGGGYREVLTAIATSGVQPQASLAKVELVEEMLKNGQASEAFNEARRIIGASQAAANAKSRARLVQAKVLEDEFLRQSVKSRVDKVATVLAIKTEKLEKAQQAFQEAIRYGDANVTVEGLKRLGFCYLHYVEALKNMPVPVGLEKEDEPAFRDELTKLAIPLEEKAIETMQEGIRQAKRLRIESAVVAEMRTALKKLNMPAVTGPEFDLADPGIILPTLAGVNP